MLAAGRISEDIAATVVGETRHLDVALRRLVDKQLCAGGIDTLAARRAAALTKRLAYEADPKELAEERRLTYVGITKAQKRLYLSLALMRSSFGQPSADPASWFLAEVPDDLVEWRRVAPERSAPVGRFGFGRRPTGATRRSPNASWPRRCTWRSATGSTTPDAARGT